MEKNPKDMEDVELLEKYSHYNKMGFRLKDEQNYLGSLQDEILRRMRGSKKETE